MSTKRIQILDSLIKQVEHATKATQDAAGNVITETYVTKETFHQGIEELSTFVAISGVTTYQEIIDAVNTGRVVQAKNEAGILHNLAVVADGEGCVFTQTEGTVVFALIVTTDNQWEEFSVPLPNAEEYYTKSDMDEILEGKSNTSHDHDSVYDAKGASANVQANLNTVSDTLDSHTSNPDIHFTSTERTKLSGIEANAQKNTITGVKGSSESTYRTGDVNITATNIGLGNVNNTSDANKPVSTAQQTAIDTALDSAKDYTDSKIATEVTNRNSAIETAKSSAISTAASDAQTKANTALSSAKTYTDTKTSGLASTSSVNTSIDAHNTSTSAHSDIRGLITDLTTKLNNFLDVDDQTIDQLSDVLILINNNKGTLESLTTSKINVSDIVNNLTTNSNSKVLSAAQGVAIKGLIDALQDELDSHTHEIADVSGLQSALDGKASSSHGTHVSYSTTTPVMDGTASVGSASTVARSDHRHPTDTSRAAKTDLDTHISNESNPHGVTLAHLGVDATAVELNYVDGVTSNVQAQLDGKASSSHSHGNITNAGAIGTTANKAIITTTNGVLTTGTVPVASGGTGATTAAAALTNLGLTATAAELNKMDGVTATTAELNILDGVTATTAELNYMDGVTSNVQTQLDTKASKDTATTSANGLMSKDDKVKLNGIAEGANKYTLPNATTSTLGGVKVGSNISVSSGTISVPSASKDVAGVTVIYPKANCTTYTSDSGTCTPAAVKQAVDMFSLKVGGNVAPASGATNGHIYLTGAKESSSSGNTTQIVFGTSDNEHVALSSNTNMIVINPNTTSTTDQILLKLSGLSTFPKGIQANVTGNLTGTADKAKALTATLGIIQGGTGYTTIADTTYTTARYRASSLHSSVTNPDTNGVICWTYE